ncbi:autophagy protein Atg27, putative [Paecilomyces variotii No. 5]|uniref:Autophagy-related protein 27 n=1 Tax=Byssochlamys spectabilis (strain No. 5 / NBRC 109023) TaxID=1356009 RepID=V5HWT8_BYSSN|nr:autophagy protein Atg27, putative [Paecilomyces variotii No. 5]
MRLQSSSPLIFLASLLPSLTAASGFDCAHIRVDGIEYDLSPLAGVHSLYHVEETEDVSVNTTYVLNICKPLKGAAIRGKAKCGTSKNICGFQETRFLDGSEDFEYAFPVAGLDPMGHGSIDPEVTRLKQLDSTQEGLLVKLNGGEYREEPTKPKSKKGASAVIEFQCDPDRTGLEGLKDIKDDDEKQERRGIKRDDDDKDKDGGDNKDDDKDGKDGDPKISRSLSFKSFGPGDDKSYVLKLDWKTKYACDNHVRDNKGSNSSSHWGFFTWLIIIVFLCTAAYLIFGSWLNYNRYGARGWDLLPHGDTIRDVPYIFNDWIRRVINTVQGTGTRGGYSAV